MEDGGFPNSPVPLRRIEQAILVIRGHRVMLSTDLAALYDVEPKVLVQTVKRNIERFPDDFMFQLTRDEYRILKSQFVTSSWGGAPGAALRLHRAGRGDAVERAAQQAGSPG